MTVSELIEALKGMPKDAEVTMPMIEKTLYRISNEILEDICRFIYCRTIFERRRFINSLDSDYRDDFIRGLDSFFSSCLTPREKNIFRKRYGVFSGTYTEKQIASQLDLSVERIRQIADRANLKLFGQLGRMQCD